MEDPEMSTRPAYVWKTSEDDAKRFHSWVRVHQLVLTFDEIAAGRYIAVQLWDGDTDGVVYDTRQAALDHQTGDQTRSQAFIEALHCQDVGARPENPRHIVFYETVPDHALANLPLVDQEMIGVIRRDS